ncbi:MAG: tetratricopeptide repeat protein [Planctomycetes bacterium]|nr:tetratricopeptide repeat protein [Planctomycetota bacterium]MBE7491774.1 tetratricopeptide repeat protein [Planctomycetota bacterium]MCL4729635.1 tetratricopeptide repeat protein [Planctomycetota bacterium]
MHAEQAYLFRHALLRDAAYEMQLPGDRAKLHELAFFLIEEAFGGRAPEPPPLDDINAPALEPHTSDAVAADLAMHAGLASSAGSLEAQRRDYLRRAAEYAQRKHQTTHALALWSTLADASQGIAKGEALRRAAHVAYHSGMSRLADTLLQQAVACLEQSGGRAFLAVALNHLSIVTRERGDIAKSEVMLGQAMAMMRELKLDRYLPAALVSLANLYRFTGRGHLSEATLRQALDLLRNTDNQRLYGIALGNLASTYITSGRAEQAESLLQESYQVSLAAGNPGSAAIALGNIALCHEKLARWDKAEETYHRTLTLAREIGDRRTEGVNLGNMAQISLRTGRTVQALHLLEQAVAIHQDCGNRRFEAIHLCDTALCHLRLGAISLARACWRKGIMILHELKDVQEAASFTETMQIECKAAGVLPLDDGAGSEQEPGAPATG